MEVRLGFSPTIQRELHLIHLANDQTLAHHEALRFQGEEVFFGTKEAELLGTRSDLPHQYIDAVNLVYKKISSLECANKEVLLNTLMELQFEAKKRRLMYLLSSLVGVEITVVGSGIKVTGLLRYARIWVNEDAEYLKLGLHDCGDNIEHSASLTGYVTGKYEVFPGQF